MKTLLCLFISCAFVVKGMAEMIGPVEYYLPPSLAEDWGVRNTIENRKSKTIVYVPNEAKKGEESFGVNVNKFPSNIDDLATIKATLAKQFPDMNVHLDILERKPNSLLLEWKAKDNGHERVHGWTRLFSIPDETVVLMYQTDDLSTLEDARCLWVEALKRAKISQNVGEN